MEQPREPENPDVRLAEPVVQPVPRPRKSGDVRLQDLARWLYTNNPFYALSAMLVFWGLHSSFDTQERSFRVFALMGGLVAYTLLLALAAYVVIHFGKVWDDGRTLLVLLVLMFLGISVSFDDALMANLHRGTLCDLGGLLLAVLVSEGLLRGLGLRLPALFRLPYYLLLGLFFLYPVIFCWTFSDPDDPVLPWALLAFPTVAGLVGLTLLAAIPRGPRYVADNGSPWHWPWYPWTLFVMMGLGVCVRSFYLCVSMHQAGGTETIFAPYFLVPLLLVACLLLLQIGRAAGHALTQDVALIAAGVLLPAAMIPPSSTLGADFLHHTFLPATGCTPLLMTAVALAVFYAWAIVRRVRGAVGALSAVLVLLALLTPRTAVMADPGHAHGLPILLLGLLQAVVGLRRQTAARWFAASCCVVLAISLDFRGTAFLAYRGAAPAHLLLAAVLVLGAVCRDPFGRVLQYAGALLLFAGTVIAVCASPEDLGNAPASWLAVYPLLLIVIATAYGYLLHDRLYFVAAAMSVICWLTLASAQGYRHLRQAMAGVDYILGGLACMILAMLISWTKTGLGRRWLARHQAAALRPPQQPGESNRL